MDCCETREHHGHHDRHSEHHGGWAQREGSGCCCTDDSCHGEGHHGFRRRYRNKAELIEELESYLAELKAEAQGVEERLAELRG